MRIFGYLTSDIFSKKYQTHNFESLKIFMLEFLNQNIIFYSWHWPSITFQTLFDYEKLRLRTWKWHASGNSIQEKTNIAQMKSSNIPSHFKIGQIPRSNSEFFDLGDLRLILWLPKIKPLLKKGFSEKKDGRLEFSSSISLAAENPLHQWHF